MCLRRTRALLNIAQPNSIERKVVFSKAEKNHYKRIMKRSRKAIDDAVSGRTGTSSRNTMLKVLLELRIFCNQGTFSPEHTEDPGYALDADEQLTLLEEQEHAFCDTCFSAIAMVNQLEDATSGVLGQCSHVLCRTCYDDALQDSASPAQYDCPVCEKPMDLQQLQVSNGLVDGEGTSSQHSSKLNALTDDLLRSQNAETPEKRYGLGMYAYSPMLTCCKYCLLCMEKDPQHRRRSLPPTRHTICPNRRQDSSIRAILHPSPVHRQRILLYSADDHGDWRFRVSGTAGIS